VLLPVRKIGAALYFLSVFLSNSGQSGHAHESTETSAKPINYPDSDGKPMADTPNNFAGSTPWSVVSDLFADDPTSSSPAICLVSVGSDKQDPHRSDALVAFGRPKGDRGSYKQ